jgi:hypothetical protein
MLEPVIRQYRVRRRAAQTPVLRYENRKTGRTVTLIATLHIGATAYFQQLTDIIAGLAAAGAVICYEGIRPAGEQEWAAAADSERAVRGLSEAASDRGRRAACRYLGWVEQGTALKYSPSWRNVDMTDLEVVRRAQPHNMREQSDGFSTFIAGLTPEQFQVLAGAGQALVIRLLSVDHFDISQRVALRAVGDAHRHVGRVIVDERNRGAIAGLPPDTDAVLVWGSGHLPGLAASLKNAGYRHRSTAWVTVGELPALWPCLQVFWRWLRSAGEFASAPSPSPDAADAPGS